MLEDTPNADTNQAVDENQETPEEAVLRLQAELAAERAEKIKVDNKNAELVREKQAANTKKEEAQRAKIAADRAALEASGDVEALKRVHAEEMKATQNALSALVADVAIKAAIAKYGVKSEYAEGVEAMLYRKHRVDGQMAYIGDETMDEWAGKYFSTDAGKHWLRAVDHSGGGAAGSSGEPSTTPFSEGEYLKRKKVNPDAAARWAQATGNGWIVSQ